MKNKQGAKSLAVVNMPPSNDRGSALQNLKAAAPEVPVLMLSSLPEQEYALSCLKYGASGYLDKGNVAEEAVLAIRRILKGGKHISQAVAEKLAMSLANQTNRPVHETLSEREFQVFRLIASEKSMKEIAGLMSLSVKTVSTYRTRIIIKTGLITDMAMGRYAAEHRLLG